MVGVGRTVASTIFKKSMEIGKFDAIPQYYLEAGKVKSVHTIAGKRCQSSDHAKGTVTLSKAWWLCQKP